MTTWRASILLAAVTAGVAVGGCGSSHKDGSANSATSIQDTKSPAVNQIALRSGSDQQQITATIRAFYKATWENQDAAACSLFSAEGKAGFLASAKIAFPDSVNSTTTCPQVMRFYNADLTDSVDNLQQSGVNVSGNILEVVGVSHIDVGDDHATAQAPEGVEEFIKPKTFDMVHSGGQWLINGTSKIGQTLAQALAAAQKQGKLKPKVDTTTLGSSSVPGASSTTATTK